MSAAVESDSEIESPSLPDHKPAFLKRVQIRNYKSIAFCDVTLEPLTLLVGRNGSGKSNFLDALGFLADLMEKKVVETVAMQGGWRSTISKNAEYGAIEFKVELAFPNVQSQWLAEYSFSIRNGSEGRLIIEREDLIMTESAGTKVYGFRLQNGKLTLLGEGLAHDPQNGAMFIEQSFRLRYGNGERLFLTTIGTSPFLDLTERLGKSRVYNFSPAAMRPHQPFQADMILRKDGDNLAYAIKVLEESDESSLERVRQYLETIVPEISSFFVQEYGDQETIRFRLVGDGSNRFREFDAGSISDGTLRVLAALIAARQLTYPLEQGFIGIEEPETSLHPAAMHALVDALDEATLIKQIILTTHSSEMLDNPTIKPDNVRVVQMIDGRTVIAPVDKVYYDIIGRKLNTLGGLERDNLLEPDLDDLERQQRLADAPREAAA